MYATILDIMKLLFPLTVEPQDILLELQHNLLGLSILRRL